MCVLTGRRAAGDSAPWGGRAFLPQHPLVPGWRSCRWVTPALPAHPISAHSLPAGSFQSSAPPALSWPAAGCQARGCQAVCAGKPSAGSASRAQPRCSGSAPHPPPSSGETPPTPVWGPDGHGDLQPVPPPCSLPDSSTWASLGAATSSLQPLYPPGSLHFGNKLWRLDAVAGFG